MRIRMDDEGTNMGFLPVAIPAAMALVKKAAPLIKKGAQAIKTIKGTKGAGGSPVNKYIDTINSQKSQIDQLTKDNQKFKRIMYIGIPSGLVGGFLIAKLIKR
jgi:hypothetical protein